MAVLTVRLVDTDRLRSSPSVQLHIIGSVWTYNACQQVHKLLTGVETQNNVLFY